MNTKLLFIWDVLPDYLLLKPWRFEMVKCNAGKRETQKTACKAIDHWMVQGQTATATWCTILFMTDLLEC